MGTETESHVGLLYEYPNRWMIEDTQSFQLADKKYFETVTRFHRALWTQGVNTDIIGYGDDFSHYDLILAPMMYSLPESAIDKFESFVSNGGTLLCTYMSGMTNENDLCYLGGFPGGKLKNVFGIWNEEIDTLYPYQHNTVLWNGAEYRAVDYCEVIHPQGAEILATYSSDFYSGQAALTRNTYGKGKAYYLAFRDTGEVTDLLVKNILKECEIFSDFDGPLPYGVTTHSRTDGKQIFVFLQNFTSDTMKTHTAYRWSTVEEPTPVHGDITLKPYETLILTRQHE